MTRDLYEVRRELDEMKRNQDEMEPDLEEVKRHLPQKGADLDTWLRFHVIFFFQLNRCTIILMHKLYVVR